MTYEEAVQILEGEEYASDIEKISNVRLFLGGHYANLNSQLTDILIKKPEVWQKIRYDGQTKSDTAAERKWEMTENGIEEMRLRKRLKSIEMMMTATNSRITVLKGESMNQY